MKTYKKVLSLFLLVLTIGILVGCGTDYTVTFDAKNDTELVSKKVASGSKVEKPLDPVKEGYQFIGWFLEETDEEFDFDTKIEKNITLIGLWTILELTVTYNTDGGSNIDDQVVLYGEVLSEPGTPIKEGFEFVGWYLNGEEYDFSKPVKNDITLTAKWEELEMGYKVIYDFNYDNLIVETLAFAGLLLNEISVTPRAGYRFAGWYKNKSFTRPWDMTTDLMPEEELTLYAKWESVPVITGIEDFTFYIGDLEPDLMANIEAIDVLDGELTVSLDLGDLDFKKAGKYEINYSAENLSGIKTTLTIEVNVVYENRLLIDSEELPQKVYLQVEEEVLGFYIELSYTGEISINNVLINLDGWIYDVNVEEGLIIIVATGLNEIDCYLLTEILTIDKNVDLTVETVIVDTITENGKIIK